MRPSRSLGQQIVWSMVASTVFGALMTGIGTYLLYGMMWQYAPQLMADDDWWFPKGIDWLEIAVLAAIGAGLALAVAVPLARRIVTPLTSVADSIQKIADGDLSARALADSHLSGEAAHLVDRFNHMAASLEKASEEALRWNALIAHELRTPVTILQGRLFGLADGLFRPNPVLYQSLLTQVEGLARLIEDLRTISLSDAGHLDLIVRDVELAHELEDVIHFMKPALVAAGFSLSLELAPGRGQADPTRLRQALMALLHNALIHATPGLLRVALTFAGNEAEILVADGGPGLPAEFTSRAFLPFERHVSQDRATRGSGLGLAVVRAVAQAHGGTAHYENKDGGACFRIRFRYEPVQPAEAAKSQDIWRSKRRRRRGVRAATL